MEIFYSGAGLGRLREILSEDLDFVGPFHRFSSADAYLESLRQAPPKDMEYEVLQAFESDTAACLIYRFEKPGVETTMAQVFDVENVRIRRITLIFDTGAFG